MQIWQMDGQYVRGSSTMCQLTNCNTRDLAVKWTLLFVQQRMMASGSDSADAKISKADKELVVSLLRLDKNQSGIYKHNITRRFLPFYPLVKGQQPAISKDFVSRESPEVTVVQQSENGYGRLSFLKEPKKIWDDPVRSESDPGHTRLVSENQIPKLCSTARHNTLSVFTKKSSTEKQNCMNLAIASPTAHINDIKLIGSKWKNRLDIMSKNDVKNYKENTSNSQNQTPRIFKQDQTFTSVASKIKLLANNDAFNETERVCNSSSCATIESLRKIISNDAEVLEHPVALIAKHQDTTEGVKEIQCVSPEALDHSRVWCENLGSPKGDDATANMCSDELVSQKFSTMEQMSTDAEVSRKYNSDKYTMSTDQGVPSEEKNETEPLKVQIQEILSERTISSQEFAVNFSSQDSSIVKVGNGRENHSHSTKESTTLKPDHDDACEYYILRPVIAEAAEKGSRQTHGKPGDPLHFSKYDVPSEACVREGTQNGDSDRIYSLPGSNKNKVENEDRILSHNPQCVSYDQDAISMENAQQDDMKDVKLTGVHKNENAYFGRDAYRKNESACAVVKDDLPDRADKYHVEIKLISDNKEDNPQGADSNIVIESVTTCSKRFHESQVVNTLKELHDHKENVGLENITDVQKAPNKVLEYPSQTEFSTIDPKDGPPILFKTTEDGNTCSCLNNNNHDTRSCIDKGKNHNLICNHSPPSLKQSKKSMLSTLTSGEDNKIKELNENTGKQRNGVEISRYDQERFSDYDIANEDSLSESDDINDPDFIVHIPLPQTKKHSTRKSCTRPGKTVSTYTNTRKKRSTTHASSKTRKTSSTLERLRSKYSKGIPLKTVFLQRNQSLRDTFAALQNKPVQEEMQTPLTEQRGPVGRPYIGNNAKSNKESAVTAGLDIVEKPLYVAVHPRKRRMVTDGETINKSTAYVKHSKLHSEDDDYKQKKSGSKRGLKQKETRSPSFKFNQVLGLMEGKTTRLCQDLPNHNWLERKINSLCNESRQSTSRNDTDSEYHLANVNTFEIMPPKTTDTKNLDQSIKKAVLPEHTQLKKAKDMRTSSGKSDACSVTTHDGANRSDTKCSSALVRPSATNQKRYISRSASPPVVIKIAKILPMLPVVQKKLTLINIGTLKSRCIPALAKARQMQHIPPRNYVFKAPSRDCSADQGQNEPLFKLAGGSQPLPYTSGITLQKMEQNQTKDYPGSELLDYLRLKKKEYKQRDAGTGGDSSTVCGTKGATTGKVNREECLIDLTLEDSKIDVAICTGSGSMQPYIPPYFPSEYLVKNEEMVRSANSYTKQTKISKESSKIEIDLTGESFSHKNECSSFYESLPCGQQNQIESMNFIMEMKSLQSYIDKTKEQLEILMYRQKRLNESYIQKCGSLGSPMPDEVKTTSGELNLAKSETNRSPSVSRHKTDNRMGGNEAALGQNQDSLIYDAHPKSLVEPQNVKPATDTQHSPSPGSQMASSMDLQQPLPEYTRLLNSSAPTSDKHIHDLSNIVQSEPTPNQHAASACISALSESPIVFGNNSKLLQTGSSRIPQLLNHRLSGHFSKPDIQPFARTYVAQSSQPVATSNRDCSVPTMTKLVKKFHDNDEPQKEGVLHPSPVSQNELVCGSTQNPNKLTYITDKLPCRPAPNLAEIQMTNHFGSPQYVTHQRANPVPKFERPPPLLEVPVQDVISQNGRVPGRSVKNVHPPAQIQCQGPVFLKDNNLVPMHVVQPHSCQQRPASSLHVITPGPHQIRMRPHSSYSSNSKSNLSYHQGYTQQHQAVMSQQQGHVENTHKIQRPDYLNAQSQQRYPNPQCQPKTAQPGAPIPPPNYQDHHHQHHYNNTQQQQQQLCCQTNAHSSVAQCWRPENQANPQVPKYVPEDQPVNLSTLHRDDHINHSLSKMLPPAKKPRKVGNCSVCGNEALFLCSKCKFVWYCTRSCQVSSWPDHRAACARMRVIENNVMS